MTVRNYREENGWIKVQTLGGELGIAKDQIQSIDPVQADRVRQAVSGAETTATATPGTRQEKGKVAAPGPAGRVEVEEKEQSAVETHADVQTPEEKLAEQRAKEEKDYQLKVQEITGRIQALRERYLLATRQKGGSEPSLLDTPEARRARTADLNSRLRDVQHNPRGHKDAAGIKLSTNSPFSGVSGVRELRPGVAARRVRVLPPSYSKKERELSQLRNQITQLEGKREKLIQEMRQKNFDTGSLFLE
jgi:hypothetical protein